MSKKQTAVQWLREQFSQITQEMFENHFKQALQMEREQIEEAYIDGMEFIPVDPDKYKSDAEQYYTQTYGECTQQ